MNDNDMITRDLIATVREPFAGVRMGAPVDAVVTRGQAIRRRRRVQAITGAAAAVAAAAVLAAVAALPSGRLAAVNLTAWTVITEPTGTVAVTIRDLRDPAGLQRALRAHGVPATVRFDPPGSSMPSCITSVPSRLATIESRVFVQPPAARPARQQAGRRRDEKHPARSPITTTIPVKHLDAAPPLCTGGGAAPFGTVRPQDRPPRRSGAACGGHVPSLPP